MKASAEKLSEHLTTALTRHFGYPTKIEALRLLTGGAGSESWQFDAANENKRYELILRLDRGEKFNPIYPDKETQAKIDGFVKSRHHAQILINHEEHEAEHIYSFNPSCSSCPSW